MRYKDFTSEDFAKDAFFIRWVKNPDAESDWFWNAFMQDHPGLVPAIEEAREIVSLFDFQTDNLSDDEFLSMRSQLVMAIHAEKENRSAFHTRNQRKQNRRRRWLKAAAAVAIPLLCLGFYDFYRQNDLYLVTGNDETKTEYRANPKGQKSVLLLEDGTKVWLNTDSRLSYAKDFSSGETRNVHLEGEAFFEVASNPAKPFIVHTSALNIQVLGTAFNVKAYQEEKTIETTLVHGKVCIKPLQGKRRDIILVPNQKAIFTKALNSINVEDVNTASSGAWRKDQLVFDEVPFDNVILELERWYSIKIHIKGKGKLNCKLTADMRNESIEDFLDLLQGTHKIEYSIEGSDVFIKGSLCDD
jgi:transmembrane sensor